MAKDKVISFVEARRDLSRILDQLSNGGEPVVVAKRQKPVAVIVGLGRYRQMAGASKYLKQAKGKRILKVRGIGCGVGDIEEAIRALRRSRAEPVTRF